MAPLDMQSCNKQRQTTGLVVRVCLFVGLLLNLIGVLNQMDRLTADTTSTDVERAEISFPQQQSYTPPYERRTNSNSSAGGELDQGDTKQALPLLFDVWNISSWPKQPPTLRPNCQVVFKNPTLQLCNINPYGKGGNFGDELGPPIVKRILELAFGCSSQDLPTYDMVEMLTLNLGFANRTRPCLLSVGSLWTMVRSGDHLWGTGAANVPDVQYRCKKYKQNKNLTVYSARGPKSAAQIQKHCGRDRNSIDTMDSAGDAGFLVPFLFPELIKDIPDDKRKSYCVIPHAKEMSSKAVQEVPQGLIENVAQSWESMAQNMQECKRIVSSSLHGVIFAEAFRIPSRHVGLTAKPGLFKFQDFHESLRDVAEPEPVKDFLSAVNQTQEPLSLGEADRYARRILRSFPIHLFDVEFADEDGRFKTHPVPGSKEMPAPLSADPTRPSLH